MLRNYAYLNTGLTLTLNGKKFKSKNGLLDLLEEKLRVEKPLYPIIHLDGQDIEIAFTTRNRVARNTTASSTASTRRWGDAPGALPRSDRDRSRTHFKKQYRAADIRRGSSRAVSVKVKIPIFESQTKTKLGIHAHGARGEAIRLSSGNYHRPAARQPPAPTNGRPPRPCWRKSSAPSTSARR